MKNRIVPRINVAVAKSAFKTRYRLAGFTRRSKTFDRVVAKTLFDGDEMVVLPKDHTVTRRIETDISIEDAGESTVLPSAVVSEMLSRTDDIFIMNFCLCRRSNGCEDYPVDKGCIFLGAGVHRIPEDFGHLATREEAEQHIRECADLGLVHIIGRNKLDSVWLNTGKADLLTICNCCPCCCLWNMVRNISDEIGSRFRRMDSVEVSVDADKCTGCGMCAEACFTRAISIADGSCRIDQDMCRGCGRCADICCRDAISISFDPAAVGVEVERIARRLGGSGATE